MYTINVIEKVRKQEGNCKLEILHHYMKLFFSIYIGNEVTTSVPSTTLYSTNAISIEITISSSSSISNTIQPSSDQLAVIVIPVVVVTMILGMLVVLIMISFACIIKKRRKMKSVTNEATRSIASSKF